jgi:cupin fold WbuC family metalloprotein
MKIFSKIDGQLLHMVNRLSDITLKRNDISPDTEYLQVSAFRMNEGKTFRAHMHLPLERKTDITQESWIVIKGRVKAKLYDMDGTLLAEPILEAGDCSITFRGGHNYVCMEEDSVVYEYKTGPYMGQAKDKTFIE